MARLSGLGKGLGALIPADAAGGGGEVARLEDVPVGSILPNPHQPRVHFDEEALAELSASIREIGLLQPVLVHPLEDGTFRLIAGERRWRAARRAGLQMIPAIVRTTDELGTVERALVENLHRQDLTPLEEAAAYQQLSDDFGLTHEQIAIRVGKSRSAITNTLRLMSLPASVQHLLADGRLSAGHAKALLGSPDRSRQEQLAKLASSENWSVRMVEEAIRSASLATEPSPEPEPEPEPVSNEATGTSGRPQGSATPAAPRLRPPGLLELEHLLADYLSTRVAVTHSSRRGKVVIEFADLEDLERIYHLISTSPPDVSE
ncbi:MAG: ParB/RepB/Spo0J family partition protein [Ilumatobacteraceae bacterium]